MAATHPNQTQDWAKILDGLVSGVAHQMSNRVAVLSGITDLLATAGSAPPAMLRALAEEVPKLEEAVQLLRLLPSVEEEMEALEPMRCVQNAIALAGVHPDLKLVSITTVGEQIPPVVARPTALTHEILIAIVHAAAEMTGDTLSVSVKVAGSNVVVTAGRYAVPVQTLVSARQTATS